MWNIIFIINFTLDLEKKDKTKIKFFQARLMLFENNLIFQLL